MAASEIALLVIGSICALLMAFGTGANDAANSIGPAVGAGAITIKKALILGAVFEAVGGIFIGQFVSATIRKGVVMLSAFDAVPMDFARGMLSALFGAAVWLFIATYYSLPVSTTHAIVGGIVGFALVARGAGAINWESLGNIAISWVASPLSGFLGGYLLYIVVIRTVLKKDNAKEAAFTTFPIHVGVTMAVMTVFMIDSGLKALKLAIELWISVLIGIGIGLICALVTRLWIVPLYRRRSDEREAKKAKIEEREKAKASGADVEMSEISSVSASVIDDIDVEVEARGGGAAARARATEGDGGSEVSDLSDLGSEADLAIHWWHGQRYNAPPSTVGDGEDIDLNDVEVQAEGGGAEAADAEGDVHHEEAEVVDDIPDSISRSSSHASQLDLTAHGQAAPISVSVIKVKVEETEGKDEGGDGDGDGDGALESGSESDGDEPRPSFADRVMRRPPKPYTEPELKKRRALRDERRARKRIAKEEWNAEVRSLGRHATIPLFFILQIFVSAFVALGHGANNVPNSTGPFAAIMSVFQTKTVGGAYELPVYFFVIASVALDLGLVFFGRRVLMTIGSKVTTLTPTGGYIAQLSTALTTIVCSRLGMPISTTHVLVGAVMGVGVARRGRKALNYSVIWKICVSWVITLPISAITTIALYYVLLVV